METFLQPISIPDVEANTCAELYSDKTSFNLFQKKVDEHLGKNSVWAQMACDSKLNKACPTVPPEVIIIFM